MVITCTVANCDNPARIVCQREDGKIASLCVMHFNQFRFDGLTMTTLTYLEPEDDTDNGSPLSG